MAYDQDLIAPVSLVHGLEFGDADDRHPDMFGYHYNFIDYFFEEAGHGVGARHYLDERDCVFITARLDAPSEFLMRVLMFLAMRYGQIKVLTENGYEPIPQALADDIRERVRLHMRAVA